MANSVLSVRNVSRRIERLRSLSQTYIVGVLPCLVSTQFTSNLNMYFMAYDPLD
jgi:hypothetical protein